MAYKKRKSNFTRAKKVAKEIKKHPKGVVLVAFLLVVVLALGYFIYTKFFSKIKGGEDYITLSTVSGEISFHFLTLGNKTPGDCVYVKAGETDILIDAGSEESSAPLIKNYLDSRVTDGVLEFVIATHSDLDHIACFGMEGGIFDSYVCETIIDFPKTNHVAGNNSYGQYVQKRDNEILNDNAKHYTALQCYNEEDGAKRSYNISENVTMNILYNYYYENYSSSNNNYSVCLLFNHGGRKFLFTGDLQEAGEKRLVVNNNIGKVYVYKAGHHGSSTSSSSTLLNEIKPEICIFQCPVGTSKYGGENLDNRMPAKSVTDEIIKHTTRCFATSIADEDFTNGKEVEDLNGNIEVVSKEDTIKVKCSNSATRLVDTEWYKLRRANSSV